MHMVSISDCVALCSNNLCLGGLHSVCGQMPFTWTTKRRNPKKHSLSKITIFSAWTNINYFIIMILLCVVTVAVTPSRVCFSFSRFLKWEKKERKNTRNRSDCHMKKMSKMCVFSFEILLPHTAWMRLRYFSFHRDVTSHSFISSLFFCSFFFVLHDEHCLRDIGLGLLEVAKCTSNARRPIE